jgi:hypothetical protein
MERLHKMKDKKYQIIFAVWIILSYFSLYSTSGEVSGVRLKDFSVQELRQGEFTSAIAYINTIGKAIDTEQIDFILEGASFDLCSFAPDGVILSKCDGINIEKIFLGEEQTIGYNITIDTSNFISGEYNAAISTTTKSGIFISKSVPLTIHESRHTLFDINLKIYKKEIALSDKLGVSIELINMGDPGRAEANLHYTIKDDYGSIVYNAIDVVGVETQKEFIKYFDTSKLGAGKYTIVIDLTYIGQKEPAQTSGEFSINASDKQKSFLFLMLSQVVFAFIFMAVVLIFFRRGVLRSFIASILNTTAG